MSSHLCSHCNQPHVVSPGHKETLNKHKLMMLRTAADYVKSVMTNDFKLKSIGEINNYNNFQKLRYHGLVAHVKKNNVLHRGHWLITKNGWSFLRGEISLPKFVLIRDNHIVSRSDQLVGLKDVWFGADYLQTTFEYFDEYNRPVGFRPSYQQPKKQAALL